MGTGHVRTKTIKKAARVLVEKYYPKLTLDFHTNKRLCAEVAIIPSKRLRNQIAGFLTHLMKRIQKGPVRGISFKLQEEERERKDNYVPAVSALSLPEIEVDQETKELLAQHDMEIAGLKVREVTTRENNDDRDMGFGGTGGPSRGGGRGRGMGGFRGRGGRGRGM
eukprot:TRINITY_DN56999_c0_g1_i1.p1 TRINITY_DN56999_c0_g1~~TRINITY_DN56999_c0_g1_i1.p1  ORF type:complete len:166 (-),score=11.80 TRINITY_DN56999_c0_g1_i1:281-778(-)